MTLVQQFAAWLANAMRRAGLDIDKQQGGGRVALATACNVSRSTVSRWLDGRSMPGPEHFEAIAAAVGVPVSDLLVGAGIVSAESLNPLKPSTTARTPSAEEVAAEWNLLPEDRELFFAVADQLRKRARQTE